MNDEQRRCRVSKAFSTFFSYQDFAFLVRFHCLVAMEWGKARTWIVEGVVKKGRKRHWLWGKNWWRMSVRARESYYGRIEPLRVPSAFVQCQTKCIFRKNITRNVIFFPPSFLVVSNWVLLYFFFVVIWLARISLSPFRALNCVCPPSWGVKVRALMSYTINRMCLGDAIKYKAHKVRNNARLVWECD